MSGIEIMKKARNILETKGFTKDFAARDAYGRETEPNNESATCFCALGSLAAAENKSHWDDRLANWLEEFVSEHEGVPDFNDADETTLEDVLTVFDWAIGTAEAGVTFE